MSGGILETHFVTLFVSSWVEHGEHLERLLSILIVLPQFCCTGVLLALISNVYLLGAMQRTRKDLRHVC